MASVSYTIEQSVDDRFIAYKKAYNKKDGKILLLDSKSEVLSSLLTKAGF